MTLDQRMKRPSGPRIAEARCESGTLHLTLSGEALEGATVSVPARHLAPLSELSNEQLAQVQVVSNGSVLVWRDANVDFAASGLIERIVGVRSQRAHLERIVGMTSEAKAVAARANGVKGGRPRKAPVAALT